MLKQASTVAAIVAGLMMVGAPAFAVAGDPHEHGHDHGHTSWHVTEGGEEGNYVDQFGLLNFAQDSDVASGINLCEVEVNILTIPVLSNNDESTCLNTDNDDNDDNGSHGHDHDD
ncbi:hypothetical protein [Saccharothrix texasensis]|uniref:Uncharacterized protein n=1 Tax=Saccharothrix texasensis TaxID=103734 RepID=A0A3N1H7I4_9PSEU|nr:hypothetical protein [Saccharothrix texasensis]ROP38485.1 hypothetical protein EDD40_3839 [Saccharothrix texasensis]